MLFRKPFPMWICFFHRCAGFYLLSLTVVTLAASGCGEQTTTASGKATHQDKPRPGSHVGFQSRAAEDDAKVVRLIWFPRFSPDGTLVLSAHGSWVKKEGGEARLLAAKDGAEQHVFAHPRGVRTVAWSPKGTLFVTGGYGFGIRGFDIKGEKELFQLAGERQVENLRITSDDKLLAASFGQGDIRLYDLKSRKEVHDFNTVHEGGIWGMVLAPDDNLLATGGKDCHVYVFDLGMRKRVRDLKHPGEVNGLAFTPDSRYLATGCIDSGIRIFDVKTGEPVALLKGHERGTVTDLQFTSDGKLLVSAGVDGTVRLWDMSDLKNPSEKQVLKAHNGAAFGIAISPDDRRLVSAGWDEQIKMWDLQTGELAWTWKRK
jgi:WD40 repeat protein